MELSPVRYARTPDGAEVAWAEMGSGPALLSWPPAGGASWIELARRSIDFRAMVEGLAESRRVIVCDYRGLGYSPPPLPTAADELVADVVAVADAAGAGPFALFTGGLHASVMLEVALSNPGRVSGIALAEPVLTYAEHAESGVTEPLQIMAQQDWRRYARANASFLDISEEDRRIWEDVAVETGSPETRAAFHAVERTLEAPSHLAELAVPVLVLQSPRNVGVAPELVRKAAALIPGARLARVEPSCTRLSATVEPILAFLREVDPSAGEPAMPAPEAPSDARLTAREQEVLEQIVEGKTNAQIAERLVIAPNTVASHVKHILEKLEAANRTEAVRIARRLGLLE